LKIRDFVAETIARFAELVRGEVQGRMEPDRGFELPPLARGEIGVTRLHQVPVQVPSHEDDHATVRPYAESAGIPRSYNGVEHGPARVDFQKIDDSVAESFREDLEALGRAFDPKYKYSRHEMALVAAQAAHARADRTLDRSNKAREILIGATQRYLALVDHASTLPTSPEAEAVWNKVEVARKTLDSAIELARDLSDDNWAELADA